MLRRFLDGRVWPQEDEKQVKLMMAMIHHCTGASPCLCGGFTGHQSFLTLPSMRS